MKKYHTPCKFLILVFFFTLFIQAYSNNYTVVNTLNSGNGSLREAITNANSHAGADTVAFNIPATDAGYNSATGTWTITLISLLPYLADMTGGLIFIDGNTQTINQGDSNIYGPEIIIHSNTSLYFCFALASPNSTIRSLIINGFANAVVFSNSTCINSTLRDMFIGTNFDGSLAIPNSIGVIINNGASANNILNCLISGNTDYGIAISGANSNNIKGNKIGSDLTGLKKLSNQYGVVIDTSKNNVIGGTTTQDLNLISGNLVAGIVINGTTSSGNQIKGNYIGTDINGTDSLPNASGIILAGANNTTIGGNTAGARNIISGNYQAGIVMNGSGTRLNSVKGNYIGTNKDGDNFISNHTGLILKSNSNKNIIGGTSVGERNIISGNIEIGVYIEASDSNTVQGNYLGPDVSGNNTFMMGDSALQGNGIELNTVSKYNTIGGTTAAERNVISGNRVYGLIYYGNSSYNNTSGNYIGVNAGGTEKLANATGICVDGGSNHNQINNNVLSGNKSYGIFFVTTGTYYNEFKGNKVGVNATNTDTIPNYIGVIIAAGTKYNIIGGTEPGEANNISGNYYDGIEIVDYGTDDNQIIGNIIGASAPGGFGNYNGIGIATNTRNNTISYNTISGNKYMGIILFENANNNVISYNKIGVTGINNDACGNGASGIVISKGSSDNMVGPENIIACNDTAGIIINDDNSLYNTITQNAIYRNGVSQIDIFPPGPNPNDPGDWDNGPNLLMNYPDIFSTGYDAGNGLTFITGIMDYNYQNPAGTRIELFCSYTNSKGIGQCLNYLGYTFVDSTANWLFFAEGINPGDSIVATATDIYGNTSEISTDFFVIAGIDESHPSSAYAEIYPNPATTGFNISIKLDKTETLKLCLFDMKGQKLKEQILGITKPRVSNYYIDINDFHNGLYFVSLESESVKLVRKLSILK